MKQFFPANVIIAVVVLGVLSVLQFVLYRFLLSQSMVVSATISLLTMAGAALMLAILWWVHVRTIKQQIGR